MTDSMRNKLQESLQRFSSILSDKEIQKIISIQEQPLPTGIRVNPLKGNPQEIIQALSLRYGWSIQSLSFCGNGWTIQKTAQSPGNTIEHRLGQYYLQDAASMVPVSLFDMDHPHPLILDMAASPGGKTSHLIDRTLDQGFIIANDASKGRIAALRSVLTTWGGINQAITQFPGESFGSWYPEMFDRILLDAPCSMENLRPAPNHPLRETTHDERLRLHERQVQLLTSALAALKPGGQLIYATCSLAPEEDEAVVDTIKKAFPDSFDIQNVTKKIPIKAPGLTEFLGKSYHPDLAHTVRLWPHHTGMSGFFCALITKNKSIPHTIASPPRRDFSKTGLVPSSPALKSQVFGQILSHFGLNMGVILQKFDLVLYQRNDQLFLIPERYLSNFLTLPYAFIGMALGRWLADELEPSHEFISRFGHQFTRGKIAISDDVITQWTAGRDIRHPETTLPANGQYLLVTDRSGRNLGLGKLLPKRLRNMLPRQSI